MLIINFFQSIKEAAEAELNDIFDTGYGAARKVVVRIFVRQELAAGCSVC